MTLNQRIRAALIGFGMEVIPGTDTQSLPRCFTFNYDLLPYHFVDNRPLYYKALIQVHLFLPLGDDSVALRRKVAEKISAAGFTWPESIDASDEEGQHLVFECEALTRKE